MIQTLITLLVALTAITTMAIFMFLSAIFELKKPKDAGPRFITDSFAQMRLSALKTALFNIEDELKFGSQLVSKIGSFLGFIPNLEA